MNQLNCVISYFFQLHLMLHACIRKLDLTATVQKNLRTKHCLISAIFIIKRRRCQRLIQAFCRVEQYSTRDKIFQERNITVLSTDNKIQQEMENTNIEVVFFEFSLTTVQHSSLKVDWNGWKDRSVCKLQRRGAIRVS